MEAHDIHDRKGRTRRRILAGVGIVVCLGAAAVALWSLLDDTTTDVRSAPERGAGGSAAGADDMTDGAEHDATGTVRVRLEPGVGYFIEGFEIGLRFETAAGDVIASQLWSDFVQGTGATDLDAYYQSVLERAVPAGRVVVLAEVNVGEGPGPSIPDLTGPLPCRLELDVAPGGSEEVEVSFAGGAGCLRRVVPGEPAPTTTAPPPPPSTTLPPVVAGSSFFVDVDLFCQAFELDGTWVLDEGDTSTWQSPGERHEGGTFTLESTELGSFVGDAQGVKTARFRRLGPGEAPRCPPVPR